ncbi:N-6 DNA methylase [Kitasatospora sp. NPDC048365]|uniref:N-6 DNA methylase n=1 Tax=Kitasatospora sp. NPDC048365 TaxID=3364050 RepID=UPI00371925F3
MTSPDDAAPAVVTAADIARLAGVTRAAVSNWRRRHTDFPAPAAGTATSPLFSLAEVQQWLDEQGKGQESSGEVGLWHLLRMRFGDDTASALGAVGRYLADQGSDSSSEPLDDALLAAVDEMAAERSPGEFFSNLVDRHIASTARSSGEAMSTPRLARIVAEFAAPVGGTIFDPACGKGSLLLAVGAVGDSAIGIGQDLDAGSVELAALRAQLVSGKEVEAAVGDSLREDRFPDLRADLVVCEPPVAVSDWGRDDLLLDSRWELGVPPRSEGELAWLQHCYAHTAPGGRALIVMPASVAYRKAGRRIRAELLRRGSLISVVALPAGLAAAHALPLHLWILRRPAEDESGVQCVRMIDLSGEDPDRVGRPAGEHTLDVPVVDLLDEEVDLSPGRYIAAVGVDVLAEYTEKRARLLALVQEMSLLLPELPAGPGRFETATIGVGALIRGGLVELDGASALSSTPQLDSDYLRGFLRSAANTRRSTSATGTFRSDVRSAQLPQMDIERQRDYADSFRRLAAFEQLLREAADLGARAAGLAFDGLTNGALLPARRDSATITERDQETSGK